MRLVISLSAITLFCRRLMHGLECVEISAHHHAQAKLDNSILCMCLCRIYACTQLIEETPDSCLREWRFVSNTDLKSNARILSVYAVTLSYQFRGLSVILSLFTGSLCWKLVIFFFL